MKIPDSYYRLQGEIMAVAYSSKIPVLHQEDINRWVDVIMLHG